MLAREGSGRADRRRRLLFESLEIRRLLAGDWQDPFNRLDVTGDGLVAPGDVLAVINKGNQDGFGALPASRPPGTLSYDTNGDGLLAPSDVLAIINGINGDMAGPELLALLANDTARGGTTNDDRITSDPEISGRLTDVTGIARFQARWNNQVLDVPVARNGDFSFVPPFAGDGSDDGLQTVRLVAIDARNNQTTQDFSLTLATVAPLPDRLGLTASTDTGVSATDNITRNATPIAEVTMDAGTRVELWLNGQKLGEEVTGGTSQFVLPTLAEGEHRLQVLAEDVAGNLGTLSPAVVVRVDTTPPTVLLDVPPVLKSATQTLDMRFAETVSSDSLDPSSYRLERLGDSSIPLQSAQDLPGAEVRLRLPAVLGDGTYRLTITAPPTDLAGNPLSGSTQFDFDVDRLTALTGISPASGEELVSVTRETIVRFDSPIDPATVTEDAFYLVANGQRIAGRRVVSSTERFMTFFYDSPLPAATEVRVVVDGDRILGRDGDAVDADGDGQPGGRATADFRTLPLTRIAGTNVFGFVRDSFSGEPIVGATIRVDAFPQANVVTDQNGRFELVDMPAPDFFVHIDGSTATSTPQGFTYPNVGKPFHSVPGQTVQLEMDGEAFDIFLPPMALEDVQDLSMTQETQVGFGDSGKADLAQMFPDVDPAVFDRMRVTIAPGAAVDELGNAATQATVIPVPPDRIPAPLPPNLNPALVVSIQAPGATNFDVPAAVSFPNLEGLAPGEQTVVMSFDHDAGKWVVNGTATVSDDGLSIVSDGGVIAAPGWHITQQGSEGESNPPTDDPVWEEIQRILQADYDSKKGTKDAALSHQIACIAGVSCDNAGDQGWGGGWVRDLFEFIAQDIAHNPYETGIPEWLPDFAHTVWGGFAYHFYDHLLPGFLANCSRLDSDADGDGTTDHEEFFEQAVGPCFDEVADAGEMWAISAGGAKLLVPAGAAALREFAKKYCEAAEALETVSDLVDAVTDLFNRGVEAVEYLGKIYDRIESFFDDVPNFTDPPLGFPVPFVGRETWRVEPFDQLSSFGLTTSSDYLLQIGQAYNIVADLAAGANNNGTQAEYFVYADPSVATISDTGELTIHGTTSAYSALPFPIYVFARVGDQVGFRQFAIRDNDSDGDGLGDYYERHSGLNPQQFNSRTSDLDQDGLADTLEAGLRTRPAVRDSDGDGVDDGHEAQVGENPRSALVSPFARQKQLFYSLENLDSGFVERGKTNHEGRLESVVLAPRASYRLTLLDVDTLHIGSASFESPASGRSLLMPTVRLEPQQGVDEDGDGMSLDVERVVGTRADLADTDDDGIDDLAELKQGLNPLDNRGFPTGIIASLPLMGQAEELVLVGSVRDLGQQLAYVATGSHGLAIVDATRFDNPIVLGQLDLEGENADIAVDGDRQIAVLAAGNQGLHLVDVSDPMQPARIRTIPLASEHVELVDGVAYASSGNQLQAIDLLTGELIERVAVGDASITGLSQEAGVLFVMDSADTLTSVGLGSFGMDVLDQLPLNHGGGKLFVGGGVAYVPATSYFRGGFATVDVSHPEQLALISESDVVSPFVAPARHLVANGSGLGLLLGRPGGTSVIDVMNLEDLENTNDFLTRFNLPSIPSSVTLGAGIAFVANGTAGLQVVNFLPFDNLGQAPSVAIDVDALDVDSDADGIQIQEGTTVRMQSAILDDVQVRNVELLVDGTVAANDVSFPFDFSVVAPRIASGRDSLQLQLRAFDTGGNATVSEPLMLQIVPDTFAPGVINVTPGTGSRRFEGHRTVRLRFSEPMAANTLTAANVRLVNLAEPATPLFPTDVVVRRDGHEVQLTYPPLPVGDYRITLVHAGLTDRAGNAIAGPDTVVEFTVLEDRDPGDTLPTALDLGKLDAPLTLRERIGEDELGNPDPVDFIRLELERPRNVAFDLTGRVDGSYLELVADLDRDGELDGNEVFRRVWSGAQWDLKLELDLEAGEYFVQVRPYRSDDVTPYTLDITPGAFVTPTTPADPGGDYVNALDLGTVGSSPVTFQDMVGIWDRSDFYKFAIDVPRLVTMNVGGRKDGAELRLYTDLDGDGQIDSIERFRNAQTSGTSDLTIALDLEAGEYFVEVENYYEDDITAYALTVTPGAVIVPTTPSDPGSDYASALGLGTLVSSAVTYEDMVGIWDPSDFYKFTIDVPRQVTMNLGGRTDGAELRLYADLDGDGQVDSNEQLRNTQTSGTSDLTLALDLEAGEYFVEVENYWNDDITAYTVTVTPGAVIVPTTPADPGSNYSTALGLGTLASAAVTYEDMVGVWDRSDFYKFTIDVPRRVTMNASGRTDGVELRLYTDLDGDGQVDSNERLRDTGTSGTGQLTLDFDLEAGEYFVEVENYWNDDITAYTVTVTPGAVIVPTTPSDPGSDYATALGMGTLVSAAVTYEDMVGVWDRSDFYKFTIDVPRRVTMNASGRTDGVELRLYADLNGDGQVDSNERLRDTGTSGTGQLTLDLDLEAAEYFVEVENYWNDDITAYTVTVTPGTVIVPTTPADPGSDYATALDMGTLVSAAVTYEDMVGVWDPSDFYKFTIDVPRRVTMNISDRTDGGELQLYADLDGDGQVDSNERFRETGTSSTNAVTLDLDLEAGEYFVRVENYWNDDITAYTLTVTPGAVIVPTTAADPGDNYSTALDLGTLVSSPVTRTDIYGVLDPADFYRFLLDAPRVVQWDVTGRTDGGWVELYADLDGDTQFWSGERFWSGGLSSAADVSGTWDLEAGEYFLRVTQYYGDDITAYALTVTPVSAIPLTTPQDPGDSFGTALWLGGLNSSAVTFDDMYGLRDREDFYRFTLDATRNLRIDVTGRRDGVQLALYRDLNANGLIDSGERVAYTGTSYDRDASLSETLNAGEYFIRVWNYHDLDMSAYRITVTPS